MNYVDKAKRYTGLPNYPTNGIKPLRVEVSDPTNKIISLTEAKSHLRVEHSLDDEDIAAYIDAASDYIEETTGRTICGQSKTLYFGHWSYNRIFDLGVDVDAVTSVKYYDVNDAEQTVAASDYLVEGDRLVTKRAFTCPGLSSDRFEPIAIEARFYSNRKSANIAAVACRMIVHHLYEVRTPVVVGVGVTVTKVPKSVDALLQSIRLQRL